MAVAGVFASDMGYAGDRVGDFASAILQTVASGDAPLFALSSGTPDIPTRDTRVNWSEQGVITGRVPIKSPPVPAVSGTSMVLDDTSMIARGHVLVVEATGERLFVMGVTGNTITFQRGFTGTLAQPITSAPNAIGWIKILTRAFAEGSEPPPGFVFNPSQKYNLCQIFRSSSEITGTADAVQFRSGSQFARGRMAAMNDHATQIENALLFGRKSENVQDGSPLRTMDGLAEIIESNRIVVPVTGLTYDMMDSITEIMWMRKVKGYPHERVVFGGNRFLTVLNKLARAHSLHKVEENQRVFGMHITTWLTPHGEFKLVTHPMFNQDPILQGSAIGYHPGMFRRRTLRPTRTWNADYVNGIDTRKTGYITEMSCQYGVEDTGILLEGIYNADITQ